MDNIEYCPKCKGTGTVPVGNDTGICNRCSGDGKLITGFVDSDALEKDVAQMLKFIKKIMAKMDIKEE
jgi:hypothetical protein